jgi:hypothetical protein
VHFDDYGVFASSLKEFEDEMARRDGRGAAST